MVALELIVAVFSMCGTLTLSAPNRVFNVAELNAAINSIIPFNITENGDNFNEDGTLKEGWKCNYTTVMEKETDWEWGNECLTITTQRCSTIYVTDYKLEKSKEKFMVEYHKQCNTTFIPNKEIYNATVCLELKEDCNTTNPIGICSTAKETVHCKTTYQEFEIIEMTPGCLDQRVPLCDPNTTGTTLCPFLTTPFCEESKNVTKKIMPSTKCWARPKRFCGREGCQINKGEKECRIYMKSKSNTIKEEKCELVPKHTRTSKNCPEESQMVLVPYLKPKEQCEYLSEKLCNTTISNPRTVLKPVTRKFCGPVDNESDISGEDEEPYVSPCNKICSDLLAAELVNNDTLRLCSRHEKLTCEKICPFVMEFAHRRKAHPGHMTPLHYCETCALAGCGGSLDDMAACFSSRGVCTTVTKITEASPTCNTSSCEVACRDSKNLSDCRKCFQAGCTERKSNLAACEALKICTVG